MWKWLLLLLLLPLPLSFVRSGAGRIKWAASVMRSAAGNVLNLRPKLGKFVVLAARWQRT